MTGPHFIVVASDGLVHTMHTVNGQRVPAAHLPEVAERLANQLVEAAALARTQKMRSDAVVACVTGGGLRGSE